MSADYMPYTVHIKLVGNSNDEGWGNSKWQGQANSHEDALRQAIGLVNLTSGLEVLTVCHWRDGDGDLLADTHTTVRQWKLTAKIEEVA